MKKLKNKKKRYSLNKLLSDEEKKELLVLEKTRHALAKEILKSSDTVIANEQKKTKEDEK